MGRTLANQNKKMARKFKIFIKVKVKEMRPFFTFQNTVSFVYPLGTQSLGSFAISSGSVSSLVSRLLNANLIRLFIAAPSNGSSSIATRVE